MLIPKEHGAYGQVVLPQLTAVVVAGVTPASAAWVVLVIAAFMAHEPLLVLLGRRGPRARRDRRTPALRLLTIYSLGSLVAAVVTFGLSDPDARWAHLTPILPAAIVAATLWSGREKTASGEAAVATTFSVAAVPTVVAAGAPSSTALALAVAYWVVFVCGTLAVRVIILKIRAGGDARAVRATRVALCVIQASVLVGVLIASSIGRLPATLLIAVAPALALSGLLAVRPPSPLHLRRVGWSMVAATLLASAILVLTLSPA